MIHLELWITIQDFDFPARGQPLARAKLAWVVLFLFLLHCFPFFFASLAVYTAVLPPVLESLPEPASQISRWLGACKNAYFMALGVCGKSQRSKLFEN